MATPHNQAEKGQIAKTVLMPGDPLRAKFIADHFLDNPVQFNSVRNILGYTGTYEGHPVSVMASGMGMPSIGIYSYELYKFYDVDNIIRIGSAGAYTAKLKVLDLVLVDAAWSESSFAKTQCGNTSDTMYPSKELNEKIREAAKSLNIPLVEGTIHSSDVFYGEAGLEAVEKQAQEHNLLCAEMESFALFSNAQVLGKKAACLLTISDSLVTNEAIDAEARQNSFTDMMKVALKAAE